MMPAAMIVGDRVAGLLHVVERGHDARARVCGLGSSLTVTSVTTTSMPSEPMVSASRS